MNYRGNILTGIALASICALSPSVALGWGQKGHDTVACIAESHLTDTARQACDSLLDGQSLVYWANWLDNASHTERYAYSLTWHYRNVDAGESYAGAAVNPDGDIVSALGQSIAILQDSSAPAAERSLALKMIVHFLGDIHQPMHMGHATDRGGNGWKVRFFDDDTDLHTVWDTLLPEAAHAWSHTEWRRELDRLSPERMRSIVDGGSPDSWGQETWRTACDVYDATPEGTVISYDYIARWTPVVEQQFLKGGLRLADLLNSILDPDYRQPWTVSDKDEL